MDSAPPLAPQTSDAEPTFDAAPANPIPALSPSRLPIYAVRGLIWILIVGFLGVCFVEGVRLRRFAFEVSDPIRFVFDMKRNVFWAFAGSGPEGMLNQYEKMAPQVPEWQDPNWVPWFDYGPLRMLVMKEWGSWIRNHYPSALDDTWTVAWQPEYAFTAPVLHFNMAMELLASICAFFLTWLWVRRGSAAQPPPHFCGVWRAVAAALLIWFNPAVFVSGYMWATYDSWVLPWFLLAALLASLDWWLLSGLALAVGANFKGQQLAVVTIFIVWPLIQFRVGAALRWCIGLTVGFAAITSPWLLSYLPAAKLQAARDIQANLAVSQYPPDLFVIHRTFDVPAAIWVFEMLVVAAAVPWLMRTLRPTKVEPQSTRFKTFLYSQHAWIGGGVLFIIAAVYWPWLLPQNRHIWFLGLLAGGAIAAATLLFRQRNQPFVLAAVAGGGLLACMQLFHGSHAWWDCAFHYGTIHWPYLIWGRTSNLPALFMERWGWSRDVADVAFTMPAIHLFHLHIAPFDVTSKQMFNTIFAILLPISAIAVGFQARRRDKRMLVALCTPWLLFFCFPVQIQDRYLMFGAASAAIAVGQSVGAAMLGVFLSCVTAAMTLQVMLENCSISNFGQSLADRFPSICTPDAGDTIYRYINGIHPDVAWGVLAATAIFFYLSLTRSPRPARLIVQDE